MPTYLEYEQLLSEDGQGVEASVTDVGFGVGVGGFCALRRTVGPDLAVVLTGFRGGVEAWGRGRGWGSGGLGGPVWWTWR